VVLDVLKDSAFSKNIQALGSEDGANASFKKSEYRCRRYNIIYQKIIILKKGLILGVFKYEFLIHTSQTAIINSNIKKSEIL
jgi:hypothetical protein